MIHHRDQLEASLEQMVRMYRALGHLHERMASANFENYQVFAEGPVAELARLRTEVDAYLGVHIQDEPIAILAEPPVEARTSRVVG